MTVETFTLEQFEQSLTDILSSKGGALSFTPLGLILGEHCYAILVKGTNKRLYIRSSVKRNGRSAGTGDDSIRLYVQYLYKKNWYVLGKQTWTQRTPGWQTRMGDKLRKLYKMALQDGRRSPTVGAGQDKREKEKASESKSQVPSGGVLPPVGEGESPMPPQAPSSTFNVSTDDILDPVVVNTGHLKAPLFNVGTVAPAVEDDGEAELAEVVSELEQSTPQPNQQQVAAIEAPVDTAVRVLAGPGSGKTFCVARRYAYLIANGAKPSEIIAVTFNKTMASELLSRIIKVNPSVRGTVAEKQVSTIHALCFRLLRAEGDRRNVAKEWQVKKILSDIAEKLWPHASDRPGYKEIRDWVNRAKNQGLTTANDLDFFSKCVDRNGVNVGGKLHQARQLFDNGLRHNLHYKTRRPESLLTFADMVLDIEQKLKTDHVFRLKYQAKFKWVIVDEGQDTSAQAMRILSTLAEPQKQFYIVGDTDQLLYRFAGATPEANLYEGFEERYPDGELIKLFVNYRSTQAIVEAQLNLIEFNYENANGPYDQKYLKELAPRPDAPAGQPVSFSMSSTPEQEAAVVLAGIQGHIDGGGSPGDIFIGARTRAQLGYLEGPLVKAKIPSINLCGGSFWGSKHVQDVMCYFRLAHDESDNGAFKRVYNISSNNNTKYGKVGNEYCHHRYLGPAFLSECGNAYGGIHRAAQNWRFKAGVKDLEFFTYGVQAAMEESDKLGDAIEFIVEKCYRKFLQAEEGLTADDADSSKMDDLKTVASIANQFNDPADFIKYVLDAEQAVEDSRNKDWSKYVILSTIHRLKGLERPVVFGIGFSEGVGPDGKTPAGLLPHTFSMTAPPQNGVLPTGGKGRIADDRCCAFVLVSRAQDVCHLSGVQSYRKAQMGPSRFVEEMGLSNWSVEE